MEPRLVMCFQCFGAVGKWDAEIIFFKSFIGFPFSLTLYEDDKT